MEVGLTIPQGCDREYLGVPAAEIWPRTVAVAQEAEAAGFDSLWAYDHFTVDPPPEPAPVLEPFVELAALAPLTSRVQLGHLVMAAAYRPAGLTVKMISTLDVVSRGRAVLGIGAGWKEDEWRAYGYGFPPVAERLAILTDHLEIVRAMLAPGRATYAGEHAHVTEAIHEPKSDGAAIPVLLGGNGANVTWRLAARFADELNLDALAPADVAAALPVIAARCEEIGRDPASLAVSLHVWGVADAAPGAARQDRLGEYAALGLARVMLQGFRATREPDWLPRLIEDCRAVGILRPTTKVPGV